jgi:hypothetical protein
MQTFKLNHYGIWSRSQFAQWETTAAKMLKQSSRKRARNDTNQQHASKNMSLPGTETSTACDSTASFPSLHLPHTPSVIMTTQTIHYKYIANASRDAQQAQPQCDCRCTTHPCVSNKIKVQGPPPRPKLTVTATKRTTAGIKCL